LNYLKTNILKKIAKTPSPPYVCAVFTSIRTDVYEGYEEMNDNLFKEIHTISGYLGNEYFRDENGFGINVSYWKDINSLKNWRDNQLHIKAQTLGKTKWYKEYKLRISEVQRDYDFKI
jgi:heme-degrading monooxygenase HmoA